MVREICVLHVGRLTASADNSLNIHARVTLNVECIRARMFDVFIVCVNAMTDQY
jgi:hypothetical protein